MYLIGISVLKSRATAASPIGILVVASAVGIPYKEAGITPVPICEKPKVIK